MSGLDGVINFNFDQIGDLDEDQIPMPMDVDSEEDSINLNETVERETRNVMTKYEKTRIIGARATLLQQGAPPFINVEGETDLLKIAEKELYAKCLPITVVRTLPNGIIEKWPVQQLILPPQ